MKEEIIEQIDAVKEEELPLDEASEEKRSIYEKYNPEDYPFQPWKTCFNLVYVHYMENNLNFWQS